MVGSKSKNINIWLGLSLMSVMGLRMLSIFILLPVFSTYASKLVNATASSVGLALGIYGLMQVIWQLPCGFLSDKWGRKPIIVAGLVLFIIGSILGAYSTQIETLLIARIIQGSGAIGSVLMAYAADLVSEQARAKMMAGLGISIGLAFAVALAVSPLIGARYGFSALFLLAAFLSALALLLLVVLPNSIKQPTLLFKNTIGQLITNKKLILLTVSVLLLHLILIALFYTISPLLVSLAHSNLVYITGFITALLITAVLLGKYQQRLALHWLVKLFALVILLLNFTESSFVTAINLILFFVIFNLLEAFLPALVAKVVPNNMRGSAMGFYAAAQFLGLFLGGSGAGLVHQYLGASAVLQCCLLLAIVWCLIIGKSFNE